MNEIAQLLNDEYYSEVYEKLLFVKEAFVQDTYSLEFFCGQHLNSVNVEKNLHISIMLWQEKKVLRYIYSLVFTCYMGIIYLTTFIRQSIWDYFL